MDIARVGHGRGAVCAIYQNKLKQWRKTAYEDKWSEQQEGRKHTDSQDILVYYHDIGDTEVVNQTIALVYHTVKIDQHYHTKNTLSTEY